MENEKRVDHKVDENLNMKEIKEINLTKKFPFLGFSQNLIDYFLIIGYETPSKNEISSNFLRDPNTPDEVKEFNIIEPEIKKDKDKAPPTSFKTDIRPVVLNSIGSDFTNAALDEELIIKHLVPNKLVNIYYEKIKSGRNERVEKEEEKKEANTQNILLYLKANKIYEFDDAHNERDENLKNNLMFNVYGFIFWEPHLIDGKDKNKYKLLFPKILVFISQYTLFQYFSYLSQNIYSKIKHNTPYEIPLEIQLYNIVNFTPSPINSYFYYDFLINSDVLDLKKNYTKKNDEVSKIIKKNDYNEYKSNELAFIRQLTGFPFLDINLSSIYFYLPIDMFIIIYVFSFLEIKCLFFSLDLDPINSIMYYLNILSYPFINISDLGQIYTVSKEEILDKNKIINNNITGVYCLYDKNMGLPEVYKDYIIISFVTNEQENIDVDIYYKGENIIKADTSNDIVSLFHFLKKFLNDEPVKNKNFIEKKLNQILETTQQYFMKYCTFLENDNEADAIKTKEIIFKKLNISEKTNKFKYQYDEFTDSNLSIQRLYYSFNISVMEYFHDMMKLEVSNSSENKLTDKNIQAYYEINFRDVEDKVFKSDKYYFEFNEHDKTFFKYFRKTKKFKNYLENFIKKNECEEINRQSLLISEEIMNINKAFLYEDKRDYLQIISKFYQTSSKLRKINFNTFYVYYIDNLAKIFYQYVHESKVIKIKNESNAKNQYLHLSKENILDNNILQRYSYILNNLDPKFLIEIFPHLEFKTKGNKLDEIGQNLFADFLETYLIELKIYNLNQVVSFIILIIYIISLKRNKLLFHFFEEIMKSKLVGEKCCLRKYIYFILYLLNEKVKEKIKLKKNYIRELLIYKEIMSCIHSLNEKYDKYVKTEKRENKENKDTKENKQYIGYYPNGLLSSIINNFNFYQNYYAALLERHPELTEKNKIIIEKYNNYNSEILEEGVDYKVFMQNNACEDKGAIKDDVLVGITEALEYKGVIQTTCKTCKFKIKPNLFFIHVPTDKCSSISFCSIIYSHKVSLKILKRILDNSEKSNIDEDYFSLCGNMIFYINYKEKTNNLLSRYIATSLK